ncbi:hypothetical protein RhiirA1_457426 [Rhizophagus irregularis]|uniref:Protein kinase domain-containing protein n=1 Tax=Rhizophagus irregularis TaxID=588596 RepID=A0A2N0RY89_9GLOM|nr:hypothetical protein RhiirA1_457426 [Rhizophagus irregularis]
MSAKYLNEIKTYWNLYNLENSETKEFMLVMQLASQGNYTLLNNFNNILWEDKIIFLQESILDLTSLHKLGYCHKDFIVEIYYKFIILAHNQTFLILQKLDGKICGILPYVAPEVLMENLSSDRTQKYI